MQRMVREAEAEYSIDAEGDGLEDDDEDAGEEDNEGASSDEEASEEDERTPARFDDDLRRTSALHSEGEDLPSLALPS